MDDDEAGGASLAGRACTSWLAPRRPRGVQRSLRRRVVLVRTKENPYHRRRQGLYSWDLVRRPFLHLVFNKDLLRHPLLDGLDLLLERRNLLALLQRVILKHRFIALAFALGRF